MSFLDLVFGKSKSKSRVDIEDRTKLAMIKSKRKTLFIISKCGWKSQKISANINRTAVDRI